MQEFLKKCGIKSKEKYTPADVKAGRAPRLKISGMAECKKFFQRMKKEKSAQLYGNRRMDAALMEQIWQLIEKGVHNTPEGRQKILDLKFALHVPAPEFYRLEHPVFQDLKKKLVPVKGSSLDRERWEEKHGISGSKASAKKEIELAQKQYINFARNALKNPRKCDPDYISALFDGNGCIHTPSEENRFSRISLSMERGGELALFMVMHYFGDASASLYKSHSSTCYYMSRKSLLSRFRAHVDCYPVRFKSGAVKNFLDRCSLKKLY